MLITTIGGTQPRNLIQKKVAPSDLELIKEAVRLPPSSYGLQLFKVIIIEDQELKKLVQSSYNQNQIIDCSHLFVFCNYTKVLEKDIDLYQHKIEGQQTSSQ